LAKPIAYDPLIEEVLIRYDEYMASATPGEKRPDPTTAHAYKTRLRNLMRRLKVETVGELRAAMKGLTPEKLGVTPENFVSLLRSAAGPFWPKVLKWYRANGLEFETPFPTVPAVLDREFFEAPTEEQVERLDELAIKELKPFDEQSYVLFMLALGVGLRLQEAAHLRWENVGVGTIEVRSDSIHRTKSRKSRTLRINAELMARINEYRRFPQDWVIPCHRSLENQPPVVTSKPATLRVCGS
jgi:integrase